MAEPREYKDENFSVNINESLHGIELKFENKMSDEEITEIKEAGFRWSRKKQLWYAYQNEVTIKFANTLIEKAEGIRSYFDNGSPIENSVDELAELIRQRNELDRKISLIMENQDNMQSKEEEIYLDTEQVIKQKEQVEDEPIELTNDDLEIAKKFIPTQEYIVLLENANDSEEAEFFRERIKHIAEIGRTLYEYSDGGSYNKETNLHDKGFVHYFMGNSDWYICEVDEEGLAFGYVVLDGNTEMSEYGYIDLTELTKLGEGKIGAVELDLYIDDSVPMEYAINKKYPEVFGEEANYNEFSINDEKEIKRVEMYLDENISTHPERITSAELEAKEFYLDSIQKTEGYSFKEYAAGQLAAGLILDKYPILNKNDDIGAELDEIGTRIAAGTINLQEFKEKMENLADEIIANEQGENTVEQEIQNGKDEYDFEEERLKRLANYINNDLKRDYESATDENKKEGLRLELEWQKNRLAVGRIVSADNFFLGSPGIRENGTKNFSEKKFLKQYSENLKSSLDKIQMERLSKSVYKELEDMNYHSANFVLGLMGYYGEENRQNALNYLENEEEDYVDLYNREAAYEIAGVELSEHKINLMDEEDKTQYQKSEQTYPIENGNLTQFPKEGWYNNGYDYDQETGILYVKIVKNGEKEEKKIPVTNESGEYSYEYDGIKVGGINDDVERAMQKFLHQNAAPKSDITTQKTKSEIFEFNGFDNAIEKELLKNFLEGTGFDFSINEDGSVMISGEDGNNTVVVFKDDKINIIDGKLVVTKPQHIGGSKTIETNPQHNDIFVENQHTLVQAKHIREEAKRILAEYTDEEIRSSAEMLSVLAQYEGGGGISNDDGRTSAEVLNAFYTPREVVKSVWELADFYAPNAKTVLEPSSGIGRFAENRPNNQFTLRELDDTSARIAKILHPDAEVIQGAFQEQFFDDARRVHLDNVELPKYDIVIGNPPYGENNSVWKGRGEGKDFARIEEYFLNRGLDSLKDENSFLLFVMPSSFLRSWHDATKSIIANKGELVDAYRLPNGIFDSTDVGTDIIILKKNSEPRDFDRAEDKATEFLERVGALSRDAYFKEHPEKILGEEYTATDRYGKTVTRLRPRDGRTFHDELAEITKQIERMKSEKNTILNEYENDTTSKQIHEIPLEAAEKLKLQKFDEQTLESINRAVDWLVTEHGCEEEKTREYVERLYAMQDQFKNAWEAFERAKELPLAFGNIHADAEWVDGYELEKTIGIFDPSLDYHTVWDRGWAAQHGMAKSDVARLIRWDYSAPNKFIRSDENELEFFDNGKKYNHVFADTVNENENDINTDTPAIRFNHGEFTEEEFEKMKIAISDVSKHSATETFGTIGNRGREYTVHIIHTEDNEKIFSLYGDDAEYTCTITPNHLDLEEGYESFKAFACDMIDRTLGVERKEPARIATNFVLEKLSEAGIEVIADKSKFHRLLAGTERLQKKIDENERLKNAVDEQAKRKGDLLSSEEFSSLYGKEFEESDLKIWKATDWEGKIDLSKLTAGEIELLQKNQNYVETKPGEWTHKVLFASGYVCKKVMEYEKEIAKNPDNAAAELYRKNLEILRNVLPISIPMEKLHFGLNTTIAEELKFKERLANGDTVEQTLQQKFVLWAQGYKSWQSMLDDDTYHRRSIDWTISNVSREEFPDNVIWSDIIEYIDKKPVRADVTRKGYEMSEEVFAAMKAKRKREADEKRMARSETADRLFDKFLHEGLSESDRKLVEAEYNMRFNSYVVPDYSQLPLSVDGMSVYKGDDKFRLYNQQIKGASFLGHKGNGILAYDVGVGKTATGIVANENQIQLERSKRPLIIVPNSVYSKWYSDFQELFPKRQIIDLYNLNKESTGKYRDKDNPHKLNIPANSISLITYEGLKNITFTDETCENELYEDFSKLLSEDLDADIVESAKNSEKIKNAIGSASQVKNTNYVFFEDCGWDNLTVDEAHNFKNLWTVPRPKNKGESNEYSGIPAGKPSQRALKLYAMTQFIQRNNNNRNVFLLTATPFTNSPLEVYSMMSYVGRQRLIDSGIHSLRDFLNQFAHTKLEIAVNAKGEIDYKQVMKDWKELHALQIMLTEYIDKVDGEEAGIIRPNKITHIKDIDPTDLQKKMIAVDTEHMLEVKEGNSAAVIVSMNAMRLALVAPALADRSRYPFDIPAMDRLVETSPKLRFVCDAILDMYKKHPDKGQFMYMPLGQQSHGIVKDYLVEHGIPKEAVEIINGSVNNSLEKKERITSRFNDIKDKLKIIIGGKNTSEGIDLNGNSFVMYNCSLGWNPSETVQAEGRIWRQGNAQGNIHCVYPVMNDSIDSVLYQKHDEKRSRINDLWKYKGENLNVEDINPEKLKFDLIKDPSKRAKFLIEESTKELTAELEKVKLRIIAYDEVMDKKLKLENELEEANADFEYQSNLMNDYEDRGLEVPEALKIIVSRAKKEVKSTGKKLETVLDKLDRLEISDEASAANYIGQLKERKHKLGKEIEKKKSEFPKLVEKLRLEALEKKIVLPPVAEQIKQLAEEIISNLRPMKDVEDEIRKSRFEKMLDEKFAQGEISEKELGFYKSIGYKEYQRQFDGEENDAYDENYDRTNIEETNIIGNESNRETSDEHKVDLKIQNIDTTVEEQGSLFDNDYLDSLNHSQKVEQVETLPFRLITFTLDTGFSERDNFGTRQDAIRAGYKFMHDWELDTNYNGFVIYDVTRKEIRKEFGKFPVHEYFSEDVLLANGIELSMTAGEESNAAKSRNKSFSMVRD